MDIFSKRLMGGTSLGRYSSLEGLYVFPRLVGDLGPWMEVKGRRVLNWSLNNYLGLANHPEVRRVDAEAAQRWGLAYPMGSRMLSGHTDQHEALEVRLATLVGKEQAFVVNYGYQAVLSILDALLDRNDVAVYDAESHSCIIDGVRLHIGKRFAFKHNDLNSLEQCLKRAEKITERTKGGILVISEGVFGMRGDKGPLEDIVKLKEKYFFRLFVDDAHGFGVMDNGSSIPENPESANGIDLYFSTFAKAMASIGGFVAGDKKIIQYLGYNMRSQVYAKSLPLPIVIGLLRRLEIVEQHPELRARMWQIALSLQQGFKGHHFDIGDTESPITPIYMSIPEDQVVSVLMDLFQTHHVFCSPIVYPVVPKGICLFRMIPTAVHTEKELNHTLKAFGKVKEKLEQGHYKKENTHHAFIGRLAD